MSSLLQAKSRSRENAKSLAVFSDFDGTVTSVDTSVFLLERFGSPAWREIEDRMLSGEITEMKGYAQEIASLRVSKAEALRQLADNIEIDPGFSNFVEMLRQYGLPFVILSGGIDFIIETLLKRNGFSHLEIRANSARVEGERWRLIPSRQPRIKGLCNHCKSFSIAQIKEESLRIVYIGDGLTDRCPAGYADIVFAKGELADYCTAEGISFHPYRDFDNIADKFASLIAEPATSNE